MTLTFSNAPSSVEGEEAFEVDVSLLSAPKNQTYYLRAAFYEEGQTQYFGYTFNHENNWHNSPSEHTKFFKVSTGDGGEWIGKLKARADLEASAFNGAGDYLFKIGRYTEGGSLSWSDNTATITITVSPTPTPTPTPTITPTPSLTINPTPTPYTGGGISINEFMPSPSEGEEWVEIKNGNDFEVNLKDWFIDDIAETGGSKPFPFSTTISPDGLAVIYIGTRLNNSGDTVRLLGQSGEEVETYPYTSSEKGYSFAKDESGNWQETSDPTPGEENSIVGLSTPTPTPISTPTPTPTSTPTPTLGPDSVLGLSDNPSTSSATSASSSGDLANFMCPLVEELEVKFPTQENNDFNKNLKDEKQNDQLARRPHLKFVTFLGLVTLVGSLGSFLKETGFLVK